MKKILFTIVCLVLSAVTIAQDTALAHTEGTTGMRANEKIYVVVAVILTLLIGLFIYLFRLDRKITKMEKEGRSS